MLRYGAGSKLTFELVVYNMQAYLDNASTTKVIPEVRDIMFKVMETDYANPSSKHTMGMEAEKYISDARKIVADTLKCKPANIIFTSGGTEANNQALIGAAFAHSRKGKHIISTVFEHASVHEPLIFLEKMGYDITYLPVDENGAVNPQEMCEAIRDDTVLISVMLVNNEIGSVSDIEKLAKEAKKIKNDILFHTDAIQGYAKLPVYPKKWNVDLMSASGHKFHGPKGIGFLYVADNVRINPYIYGGGQEKGMRSGTENVPGIAGLGKAAEIMKKRYADNISGMRRIKQILIDLLKDMDGAYINANSTCSADTGAPHIISVSFENVKSEVLLHALAGDGVYVSSGSACSSNHPGLSGTLQAIGVKKQLIDSTIRLSLSSLTTEDEALYAAEMIKKHVPVLRRFRSY